MKQILIGIIFASLFVQPLAFGQFFDTPGFVNRLAIKTSGQNFEVKVVSNFDIPDYQFNKDEKRLSIIISSSVANNLAEFEIPRDLIGGDFKFLLNGDEIFPVVKTNELISFITVEFPGRGLHKLDIIGTTYLSESNVASPPTTSQIGMDMPILIIIIGIVIAGGIGAAVFFKKRKKITH